MPNPVVHFEILSGHNGPDVKDFYSSLFGWKIDANNPWNYGMVDTASGHGIAGGIGPSQNGSLVTVYVEVPDLQAALDNAEKLGGKLIMPVTEIPGAVTMAQFADPAGNVIGLIKAA